MNYDEDKISRSFLATLAARRGTELHDLAQRLIRAGIKQAETGQTFNTYVNDAIGFGMVPEQVLYYSPNCYGTADAIKFAKGLLRIFDLKTGAMPCKFVQQFIYAALFCLEYDVKPTDIEMEFRLYQNDTVLVEVGDPLIIAPIMSKIVRYDQIINEIREEALA